ncbi:olfactory receptor 2K2-like [Pleurodeles waltl]|uniref:olfactory receptor 2K2-like n=1 Tax=Pleurodeles waltl TaxID=8319 RepID=UPI0037099AF4
MKIVLFVLFLIIFFFTITANSFIIAVVQADSKLSSAMYVFLLNLSLLDICFLSTNMPTCLKSFLMEKNTITYSGCVVQMYVGVSLGITQCILLAVMAWDRYIAICNPLNYHHIINNALCTKLIFGTWVSGFLLATVNVSFTMTVPFCGHNKINHIVCELAAVLRLACVDTPLQEIMFLVVSLLVFMAPMSLIIFTYLHIISTILRMPASGRSKVFSTCGSHLTVVILFYGALIVMYMTPRSQISTENEKVISVFYGVVTPALNPFIYTLRNHEMKMAMRKLLIKKKAWPGSKV